MKRRAAGWIAAGCLLAAVGVAMGCDPRRDGRPGAGNAEGAAETLAIPDPLDRSLRWAALLERASADALPGLRDAIAAAPLDTGDPEIVAFAMWWARFDPTAALEWTRTEWRAQSRLVIASVFRMWTHSDPETAFARASEVPEIQQAAALDAVIVGWYESGKPGLVERVASLPDAAFRQRVAESLSRRLVLALGAEGATKWLETVEDPAFRETMTLRIASAAAEQGDGAAIAAWAAPRVTSGDERPSGFPRRIGTRWIMRDPDGALAWLSSLPAGKDRDDGVMESYRDWMRYAPGAAMYWAQNAEVERWSEPALSIYARAIALERPKDALDLVARFTDPELRDRITIVIARAWAAKDPEAARAWLAEADLPPDIRARAALPGPRARAAQRRSPLAPERAGPGEATAAEPL